MAKGLYFDAFSGISGDMTIGALLHAGMPLAYLQSQLALLPVTGYQVVANRTEQHSIGGIKFDVLIDDHSHPHDHDHNHSQHTHEYTGHSSYQEISALIQQSTLAAAVKTQALKIFDLLAQVEGAIHGVEPAQVHFHEVGALDSIIDIVGACIGFNYFGIEEFYCSPLPLGHGFVQTQHGLLPVPAPATLQLLAQVGAEIAPLVTLKGGIDYPGTGELVTPTGAALVAALCRFERPSFKLEKSGYGYGSKKLAWPNALRIWLGETRLVHIPSSSHNIQNDSQVEPHGHRHEQLAVQVETPSEQPVVNLVEEAGPLEKGEIDLLETNLDDMLPEGLGYLMEKLLAAGALDVFFTPIQMKKNRPAVLLSVMAAPSKTADLAKLIIEESSSFGVRVRRHQRLMAGRQFQSVTTPYGEARVKLKLVGGQVCEAAPEYADVATLAAQSGQTWRHIYDLVREKANQFVQND
jgi:uncharacterized protein (TIGR00299 family) protein